MSSPTVAGMTGLTSVREIFPSMVALPNCPIRSVSSMATATCYY